MPLKVYLSLIAIVMLAGALTLWAIGSAPSPVWLFALPAAALAVFLFRRA